VEYFKENTINKLVTEDSRNHGSL